MREQSTVTNSLKTHTSTEALVFSLTSASHTHIHKQRAPWLHDVYHYLDGARERARVRKSRNVQLAPKAGRVRKIEKGTETEETLSSTTLQATGSHVPAERR